MKTRRRGGAKRVRGGAKCARCCACVRRGGVARTPAGSWRAAGADRLASPFRLVPMEALGKLKQFDAYPKTLEDFRVKTCGGATGRRWRAGVAGRGVSWSLAGPPTLSRPVRGPGGRTGAVLTLAPCPAVTIVSGLLMLLLFLSELQYYLTTEVRGGVEGVRGSPDCLGIGSLGMGMGGEEA